MTENEVKVIKHINDLSGDYKCYDEKLTHEEALLLDKLLSEVQAYRAIGTVEELQALKEKAEPYKPQEYEDKYYGCKCGEVLLEKWEEYPKKLMPKSRGLPYCLGCGQKLDWP